MIGRIVKIISGSYVGVYGVVTSFDIRELRASIKISEQCRDKVRSSEIRVNTSDIKTID